MLLTVEESSGCGVRQTIPIDLEAAVDCSAKQPCSLSLQDDIRISLAIPDEK